MLTTSEKKLISIFFITAILAALNFVGLERKNKIIRAEEKKEEMRKEVYKDNFGKLTLLAESALVYDVLNKKAIFGLRENKELPLASVTKIITAIVALEDMPRDTVVRISREALYEEGDSGLYADEKWNLDDLVKFMLVASSNDAAKAITETYEKNGLGTDATLVRPEVVGFRTNVGHANKVKNGGEPNFVDLMNRKAGGLGLRHSSFLTPSGLDLNSQAGGLGSSRDMALLFSYALEKYPDIFEPTAYSEQIFQSLSGIKHTVQNTNKSANLFPQMIASKTGLTTLAGGNLAISFDFGIQNPIIVVVLGSSEHGRFKDALALSLATVNYLTDLAKIE